MGVVWPGVEWVASREAERARLKERDLKQEIIEEVSDNLRLSVKSFQILERLLWSWDNFPRKTTCIVALFLKDLMVP